MSKYNRDRSDRDTRTSGVHPGALQEKWITEKDAIDNAAVDWTEKAGQFLKDNKLTTSSLRRFFGEVRRIESDFDTFGGDVPLLRAKLAYDAKRNGKEGVEHFYDLMKSGIIAVGQDKERFSRFVKLAEAIVAFHKAAGGSDK